MTKRDLSGSWHKDQAGPDRPSSRPCLHGLLQGRKERTGTRAAYLVSPSVMSFALKNEEDVIPHPGNMLWAYASYVTSGREFSAPNDFLSASPTVGHHLLARGW